MMEEEVRTAVSTAMKRNIKFLAKGLRSGGFPFIGEEMVSWSDYMADQVVQEFVRGKSVTLSNTEE